LLSEIIIIRGVYNNLPTRCTQFVVHTFII
jgi:hypothetical protein